MKKLVIILSVAFFNLSVFAQTSNVDERLFSAFTQDEISAMDIETLRFNTFCIENAYALGDVPNKKKGWENNVSGKILIEDVSSINFFELGIELKESEYQYYIIEGTDQILIVKPIFLIKTEIK